MKMWLVNPLSRILFVDLVLCAQPCEIDEHYLNFIANIETYYCMQYWNCSLAIPILHAIKCVNNGSSVFNTWIILSYFVWLLQPIIPCHFLSFPVTDRFHCITLCTSQSVFIPPQWPIAFQTNYRFSSETVHFNLILIQIKPWRSHDHTGAWHGLNTPLMTFGVQGVLYSPWKQAESGYIFRSKCYTITITCFLCHIKNKSMNCMWDERLLVILHCLSHPFTPQWKIIKFYHQINWNM